MSAQYMNDRLVGEQWEWESDGRCGEVACGEPIHRVGHPRCLWLLRLGILVLLRTGRSGQPVVSGGMFRRGWTTSAALRYGRLGSLRVAAKRARFAVRGRLKGVPSSAELGVIG